SRVIPERAPAEARWRTRDASAVPAGASSFVLRGTTGREGDVRMPRAEKVEKVHALAARFKTAQGAVFSDFRGLTVKDATELRHLLRAKEASFVVAKNTLTKLAAKEAGLEGVEELLVGPTGIVFSQGDPIAAAKALMDAARRFPAI